MTVYYKNERSDNLKSAIRRIEGFVEVLALSVLYYVVWWNLYYQSTRRFPNYAGRGKYVLMGVYFLLLLVLFFFCEGFAFGHQKIVDVVIAQWVSVTIVNVITYFQLSLIANVLINPGPILLLEAVDFVATLLFCWLFTAIYHANYVPRNMVMVYGSKDALNLKLKLDTRPDKYSVTTLVQEDQGYERIISEIEQHDAVIINDVHSQLRNDILKYCYERGVRTYIAPKISDIVLGGASNVNLFDTPLMLVKGMGLTSGERIVKRGFDVLLSLIALIVASPFMLLIAIAIKLEDGGPVFYRQERVTRNGELFYILKFRSMIVDAEKQGEALAAVDGDPRITRVGKIIRRTRMDELPQIFNILGGSMSICGPRPERKEFNEEYTRKIPEFSFRLKVKGGLTGYAQIYGKYNTSAYDKLRLDLMYIENYSILLDIKLVLMTLRIIFRKESTEGFEEQVMESKTHA